MRHRARVMLKRGPTSRSQVGAVSSPNRQNLVRRNFVGAERLFDLQRTHGNAFVQRLVQRRLAVGTEKASGQEIWPFAQRHYTDAEGKSNVGPLVQRNPLGTGAGAVGTYVARPGDSLSLIAGYPNGGWPERLDQLIAANPDHPNIKNRTPDDPRYGWLEIGDVVNIPWMTSGTPASSAPSPSIPAPPSLDSPANVRVLQAHLNLGGAAIPVTGRFDARTITALELWQRSRNLRPSGIVDSDTVEALLAEMVANDEHEFAIPLVADAEGLDTSGVVALRTAWTWNPSWTPGDVHVEWEGPLREIWVAKDALSSRVRLVAALEQGLAVVPPAGAVGPVPAILAPADEAAAITQVSSRLGEPIAISALRGIVGASPGTVVDAELVQRLADWQGPGSATGQLDESSLDRIVQTERAGRENSVIRLVMDAFDLGSNALVSVLFEDDYLRQKTISAVTDEFSGGTGAGAKPSIIYIGPSAFVSLAELLQNIMHELVHVELSAQGILQGTRGSPERALHEFLGEATEILAAPTISVYDTVLMDGTRALANWQGMTQSDRVKEWSTFESVRKAVLQAIATVPQGDRDYNRYQKVRPTTWRSFHNHRSTALSTSA